MSDKAAKPSPPYASFSAFTNFINKLRETTVPHRIDASVFGNASGSVSYSVIATLKSLKLIGADGVTTPAFSTFVKASDEDRKPILLGLLKAGYPTLWDGSINLETATAGQFDEHMRLEYAAKGSTVDKVAAFFLAAAKSAGLTISPHLAARKATATSASSTKSRRQRKAQEPDNTTDTNRRSPPPAVDPISDKALEYKLVDLLKDEGVQQEQQAAIWTLIQYLTAKAKTSRPGTAQHSNEAAQE
jgi:hypothetical protein